MQSYQWIFQLKNDSTQFLNLLKDSKKMGFFHYSLSGDILPTSLHWGLGNAVFFLKCVYTIGAEETFVKEIESAILYIRSFEHDSGNIYDPWVRVLSTPKHIYQGIRTKKWADFFGSYSRLGETRQAISALRMFDPAYLHSISTMPGTESDIDAYLTALDWTYPWHAGAQWSILVFMLSTSAHTQSRNLVPYTLSWIDQVKQEDGWYTGVPSVQEKINGSMKVITGMKAVGQMNLPHAKALIDMCLSAEHDAQACDNFNIVYVLKYADEVLQGTYRHEDIVAFVLSRLDVYKQYYYPDLGGFSFHKGKANRWYYGAPISRAKHEPDIHGTTLFLWGIALIAQIIGIDAEAKMKEFVT